MPTWFRAYPATDPLLRRSYIGALVRSFSGGLHELYGFMQWIADQAFPDTAESAELLRWAAIWGLTPVPAAKAEGAILVEGTAGTVVPANTLWRSGDAIDYQSLAEFVMPAAETGNIDVEAVSGCCCGQRGRRGNPEPRQPDCGSGQPSERIRRRWPVARTSSRTLRCGRGCCRASRIRRVAGHPKTTNSGRRPRTRT